MRKFSIWLLIFIAGWGLSRVSYHYLDSKPLQSAQPVEPAWFKSSGPRQPAVELALTTSGDDDDLARLLQRNEFESSVEHYASLQDRADGAAAVNARRQILAYASQLLAQQRYSLAQQLLQSFLLAAYRDVDVHLLLAEACIGEENYSAAIDQFYEARGYAYRPLMLQTINSRIRSFVAERTHSLKATGNYSELLALYQHLTRQEADHAPWFIGLAAAQLALEDKDAARRSLLLVLQDADVGAQAQVMLAELSIAQANTNMAENQHAGKEVAGIPLYRRGNHFIVDARQDHGSNVRLLIDTGASMTILTPIVLEQAGLRYHDTGRSAVFNTANGQVQAPVYTLDSLAVGDWQVNQLDVGVLDLSGGSNIDGLLGMNFLRHFQFFIDQNEALLRLSVQ